MNDRWCNRSDFICVVVLAMLTAVVYMNTLGNGFVWDDWEVIVGNPLLQNSKGILRLLLAEDTFLGEQTGYYRPVTYLSFLLERMAWGVNPEGYHLVNLLLHVAVVSLFYLLLTRFNIGRLCAFSAAALFAVHPVNAETVNFLSGGRNTLLAAFFTLSAFLLHLERRRYLSLACYTLAVFSKEFALLLPLLLWLYDRLATGEKKTFRQYAHYLLPATAFLVLRSLAVTSPLLLDPAGFPGRLATIPAILTGYGRSLLYLQRPTLPRLVMPGELVEARFWALFAVMLGAAVIIAWLTRKDRLAFFSFAWILIFFLPVLNIVPLGPVPIADRYAYFSAMGFSLLLALVAGKAGERWRLPIVAIVVILSALVVVPRNRVWRSNDTLYAAMIADSPRASMGYQNMAIQCLEKGDVENARAYLEKAVAAHGALPKAFFALGSIYFDMGQHEKAIEVFRRQIAVDPGDFKPYMMISRISRYAGDAKQAQIFQQQALALEPKAVEMFHAMAIARCSEGERLLGEKRFAEAERIVRSAIRFEPDFAAAHITLGSIIAERGELDEAMEIFHRAAALDPQNPLPYYNLALANRLKGRNADAERFRQIYKKRGGILPLD